MPAKLRDGVPGNLAVPSVTATPARPPKPSCRPLRPSEEELESAGFSRLRVIPPAPVMLVVKLAVRPLLGSGIE
jgi:hypothetical protein